MKRITTLLIGGLLCGAAGMAVAADPVAAAPAVAAPAPLISQSDLLARLEKKDPSLVVLDVRTPVEFAAGHVPGAKNISHDELPAKLAELAAHKDQDVVLYCRSGRRTQIAEGTLRGAGFTKLLHLEGDYLAWEAEKRPIEK
jgi:phage shock protein E